MDAASLSRLRVKLPKWHLRRLVRYRPGLGKLALRNPARRLAQLAASRRLAPLLASRRLAQLAASKRLAPLLASRRLAQLAASRRLAQLAKRFGNCLTFFGNFFLTQNTAQKSYNCF